MINPAMSEYYGHLFQGHPSSSDAEIAAYASLELARQVCLVRDEDGIPVSGFDLAGREDGYPAWRHREAYDWCHRSFLKKTVHAGEAYGAESIFQAITELHTDRIGHGYHLFDEDRISAPNIRDKAKYIRRLADFIADRRITIEVCLTSNLQTNPSLTDLKDHSFRRMLEHGLSTTFCTDNRLVTRTTVTDELRKAVENFLLTPKQLHDIVIYGFKRSFFPGSYVEKRAYCRSVISFFAVIAQRHGVAL
jgi:adenosine deaminase